MVKEACDAASPDGQPMHVVPVDVTGSEDSLKECVDTVLSTVSRIDYCFLAAGVSPRMNRATGFAASLKDRNVAIQSSAGSSQSAAAEETKQATAHEIMDLNASGVMDVGRAFLPRLIAQGYGQMVVIASMAARVPSPGQAEYSASKHALLGYVLALCMLSSQAIRDYTHVSLMLMHTIPCSSTRGKCTLDRERMVSLATSALNLVNRHTALDPVPGTLDLLAMRTAPLH